MRTALLFLIFICQPVIGQQVGAFKQMRYEEDYSYLSKDTLRDWYDNVKYTKINKNAFVSFGGDFRTQYLLMDNEAWNPELKNGDGYTLTRWLLHANLHLSSRIRIFAELQSALSNSKTLLIPVEENPLGTHQLFIDYKPFKNTPLILRLGRQEVSYGSQRLISLRDSPNSRRSFDGIKAVFSSGKINTDVFYLHAVVDKTGIFDDTSSSDLRVWGTFSDISIPNKKLNFNFYYLGFYNKHAIFNDGPGTELRHTLSARIFKNGTRWHYDLEGGYQFGNVGNRKISAWSTAVSTSYSFTSLKYLPEVGFKADLISGDKNKFDNKQQTLNALFPPGAYFGMAAPIAPSNLMDIHPSVTLHLAKPIAFICDYAFLWRYSRNDGIYRPNMTPFFETGSATSRYIGSQISGTFTYQHNKYIFLVAGMSWFNTGAYIKEVATSEDILFGFASAQIKF